jgi:hypothetical protein
MGASACGDSQRDPMRLSIVVRRLSIAAFFLISSGCAANPEKICASQVPQGWTHVAPPTGATAALTAHNPDHLVRSKHTLWFFDQSHRFIACTLDKRARDTCSVVTTEFEQTAGDWIYVGGDAVLCNILLTHGGS